MLNEDFLTNNYIKFYADIEKRYKNFKLLKDKYNDTSHDFMPTKARVICNKRKNNCILKK